MNRFCQHCDKSTSVTLDEFTRVEVCSGCSIPFGADSAYIGDTVVQALAPGTIISGFRVEEQVGQGGMGTVYKATQMNLERHVALKILSDELSRDLDFVERFFREARSAASLSHPNIVQAFDAGATPEGIYYFAMEFIEGETLDTRIERDGKLTVSNSVAIALKMADALNYAWEKQKLTHGDIKPDNIILNSSGGAKLSDLGLAKTMYDEYDKDVMCTPMYAAPEVIECKKDMIGVCSDIYSFGATFYHMLAGIPPFYHEDPDAVMKMHLNEKYTKLHGIDSEITIELSTFVDRLLEKDLDKRPQSWADVLSGFMLVNNKANKVFHISSTDVPSSDKSVSSVESKKSPVIIVLLLLLIVTFAMLLFQRYSGGEGGLPVTVDVGVERTAEPPEQALQKLRRRIKYMEIYNAISEVDKFISVCTDTGIRQESKVLLAKLKLEAVEDKKVNAEHLLAGEKFKKRLRATCKRIEKLDIETELNLKKLENLDRQIGGLLSDMDNRKYLNSHISSQQREFLNAQHLQLVSRIMFLREEKHRLAKAELVEKERARRIVEQRKKDERIERVKAKELFNKVVDSFYLTLVSFLEIPLRKRHPKQLANLMDNWYLAQESGPGDYMLRAEFIKKNFVLAVDLQDILIRNKELFLNELFPYQGAEGFRVERFDKKYIRLFQVDGKVRMGKRIRWSKIDSEEWRHILKKMLFLKRGVVSSISASDQVSIMVFLLSAEFFDDARVALKSMNKITDSDVAMWLDIVHMLEVAEKEKSMISIWKSIRDKYSTGDLDGVVSLFEDLCFHSGESEFAARYVDSLDEMREELFWLSPEIQALQMADEFKTAMAKDELDLALNLAMVAAARYGKLRSVRPRIKEVIAGNVVDILSRVKMHSSIEGVGNNRLPFCYWEYETPVDAWVFEGFVRRSSLGRNKRRLLGYLTVGVDVNIGVWRNAESFLRKHVKSYRLLSNVKGAFLPWVPSLLFGFGLVAERYQGDETNIQSDIVVALDRLVEHFSNSALMRPLAEALAIEYALLSRRPQRALDFASKYHISQQGGATKMDFKVAALHILTLIQLDETSYAQVVKVMEGYKENFKHLPGLKADFFWLDTAVKVFKGNFKLDQELCEKLSDSRCFAGDICARVLLDSIVRSTYLGVGPRTKCMPQLLTLLDSKVTSNVVSGELWEKLVVFKVARVFDDGMDVELERALMDRRICTIRSYPGLLALKSAVDIWKKRYSPVVIQDAFIASSDGAPVFAQVERKVATIMIPGGSNKLVERFFLDGAPAKGFKAGIAASLINSEDPSIVRNILDFMESYRDLFSWEERYLMKLVKGKI